MGPMKVVGCLAWRRANRGARELCRIDEGWGQGQGEGEGEGGPCGGG